MTKINKMIDPDEYFNFLKNSSQNIEIDYLEKLKEHLTLKRKELLLTQQDTLLRKIDFHYKTVLKEIDLIKKYGIKNAITYENLKTSINNIEGKAVKIVELKNYMRDIPKEIIGLICQLKEDRVFDEYYIVFTDYTHETSKAVEKERQKKDPILFGAFLEDKIRGSLGIHERLYFLADWIDEYCDLTYDKLLNENVKKGLGDFNIDLLKTVKEKHIEEYVNNLKKRDNPTHFNVTNKDSMISKILNGFSSFLRIK